MKTILKKVKSRMNHISITTLEAPELDIYARLTENQLVNRADPENALFVAESPLVIGRALDAGCTPVSFLMERKHIEGKGAEVLARCPADIPVYAADLPVLTQLTGFHLTRGMLCAMRRPPLIACQKPRRVCVRRRKKFSIIFHRDMCVGKNTSQAASVEFCRLRQNYARSRLQAFWQKKRSFFARNF